MKHRLARALKHASVSLDPDTNLLRELPSRFYSLAERISHQDFCTTYILLMRHPEISPEWVIRGKGAMLVDDDIKLAEINGLRAKVYELEKELEREIGRNILLIDRLNQQNKPGNGRPRTDNQE